MFLQIPSLTFAWASPSANPKKRAGQWRIKYKANLFVEKGRLINISGIYPEIRNVGVSPGASGNLAPRRSLYMNLLS